MKPKLMVLDSEAFSYRSIPDLSANPGRSWPVNPVSGTPTARLRICHNIAFTALSSITNTLLRLIILHQGVAGEFTVSAADPLPGDLVFALLLFPGG